MKLLRALILYFIVFSLGQVAWAQDSLSEKAAKQELSYLHITLEQAHFDLYAHRSREEYRNLLNEIYSSIEGPQSRLDMAKIVQRYVAYGKIGHAKAEVGFKEFVSHIGSAGKFLPVFIRVEEDQVFLTRPSNEDRTAAAGDELKALNGRDIFTLLDKLGEFVSAERDEMRNALMEESFPALLWLELGDVNFATLTLAKAGNEIQNIEIKSVDYPTYASIRENSPTKTLSTEFGTRDYQILDNGIAYLRPGPFVDLEANVDETDPSYSGDRYFDFIDEAFVEINNSGASDLIIDLRHNPGGNNNFSDAMIAYFADKPFRFTNNFQLKSSEVTKANYKRQMEAKELSGFFAEMVAAEMAQTNGVRYNFNIPMVNPETSGTYEGTVWVLINRHSYSNATTTAAIIKDYGFGNIIGQETADLPTTYASILTFTLPETNFVVTYPKSYFIRPNGDTRLQGVIPDVVLPFQPIGADNDVVLEAATQHILRSRK